MSSHLFTPITFRDVTIDNRIAVSSMCQYISDDGNANDWHLMHLGQFAMGAAGLVMTEATHVSPQGRITPRCLGIYSDDNERSIARIVAFCRQHGVAKLGVQLAHAGRKGSNRPPLEGGGPLEGGDAWETLAPSALPYADWPTPREMDAGDLAAVKAEFVHATERATRIDFDLIELHAGHGYLLHQFLSPLSNQRRDGYGGSLEARLRFPLEVFEACRARWPDGRSLAVRLSATDWVDGGLSADEAVICARELAGLGCDFVDVTSAGLDPRQQIPVGPGYQVHLAEQVRREAGIPTMAVGLITEPAQAEAIVAAGQADMVALARGMMDDPRWAWRAARALGARTAYPVQYERCRPDRWRSAAGQYVPSKPGSA